MSEVCIHISDSRDQGSTRDEVPSLGVLWARAHLANKPTLHRSNQTRARGAWRQTDHLRDLAGHATCAVFEHRQDGLLRLVERRGADLFQPQCYPESIADLLERRWCEPDVAAAR